MEKKFRVLVGCEFSGIVRDAFNEQGCEAYSCDLLPSERNGNHFQCDVSDVMKLGWDLAIFHPPCTYLSVSGLHWNGRIEGRQEKTEQALMFVRQLLTAPIEFICLENPVSCISTRIRKPDQIIQPFQFGHPESKQTCLWLKNLPKLKPTNILKAPAAWVQCQDCEDFWCTIHRKHVYDCKCPMLEKWYDKGIDPYESGGRWENQTPSGQNKLAPSPDRWKERSRTYEGIAKAMAIQYTEHLQWAKRNS
jgi:hypothetical protein